MLIVGGLLMMIPFFWMLLTSLKTRAEVFGAAAVAAERSPLGQLRDDVERVRRRDVRDFFLNSVKLASLNTIGQVIACSMAAYAFAVIPFRAGRSCSASSSRR